MTLHRLEKRCFLLVMCMVFGFAPILAQVEAATVLVDGMACPFCAFGIEKRLKKVEGVGSIEIDVPGGFASLRASEGDSIEFSAIPEEIHKAGFTPEAIQLTAAGAVAAESDGRLLFTVGETDQVMLLVNLRQEIQSKISELASAGVKVRIRGSLHSPVGELPGLEPDEVEVLQP